MLEVISEKGMRREHPRWRPHLHIYRASLKLKKTNLPFLRNFDHQGQECVQTTRRITRHHAFDPHSTHLQKTLKQYKHCKNWGIYFALRASSAAKFSLNLPLTKGKMISPENKWCPTLARTCVNIMVGNISHWSANEPEIKQQTISKMKTSLAYLLELAWKIKNLLLN